MATQEEVKSAIQSVPEIKPDPQTYELKMSQSIEKLAAALALAQSKMRPAVKDKENPFFKSTYADLASVWESCRVPLTENGLSVVQLPTLSAGKMVLITILMHSSGQYIRGEYPVVPLKTDPQGIGSALTYARRYSLAAMIGASTGEEDDDGESAEGRKHADKKPSVAGKPVKCGGVDF